MVRKYLRSGPYPYTSPLTATLIVLDIARAKGKLRGKQPNFSDRQQRELCRIHATGEYSISDLAELFSASRPTVYRTLNRCHPP